MTLNEMKMALYEGMHDKPEKLEKLLHAVCEYEDDRRRTHMYDLGDEYRLIGQEEMYRLYYEIYYEAYAKIRDAHPIKDDPTAVKEFHDILSGSMVNMQPTIEFTKELMDVMAATYDVEHNIK